MDIIPDDYATALQAFGMKAKTASPIEGASGYYRGWFNLSRTGDTFLNVENLGKGQVYVNGHALGRFWHIGPQQTLYVPGCWLRKGRNEVIVLDVAGPKKPVVWCQDSPELDKLQTEKPRRNDNPENRPDLASSTPIAASSFTSGNGWQTVRFAKPAEGRHIAIECLTTHDGTGNVQIAELYLLDTAGRRISREPWTVKYADSEDINRNMTGEKAFDLQESTYWSTAKTPKLLICLSSTWAHDRLSPPSNICLAPKQVLPEA